MRSRISPLASPLLRFPRSLSVVKGSTASRTTRSDSAATSLRAGPALIHPLAHLPDEFGIAHRRRGPSVARRPTPFHQRSLQVIDDTVQTLSTVMQRVLHLPAQLPGRFAFE